MNTVSLKAFVSKDTAEIFLTIVAAFVFSAIYSYSPVGVTLLTLLLVCILPVLLKRIEYAVCLFVIILPFKDLHIISIIHLRRLLIWSLFAYLLVKTFAHSRLYLTHNFRRFLKYSLWFLIALIISVIKAVPEFLYSTAVNQENMLKTMIFSDSLVVFEAFLMFSIAYLSLKTYQQGQCLLEAILAIMAIVAFLGILQYYFGNLPASIAWLFNTPERDTHRATSVFTNPNGFGHFLAPTVSLGFALVFLGTISKKKRVLFVIPCLFLGLWGVFISFSRATVLQVFFGITLSGLLYYLKLHRGRATWKIFVVFVIVIGFLFAIVQYYEWYAQLRVKTNILQAPYIAVYKIKSLGDSERKDAALMAIKTFLSHPVFGIGYGVFARKNIFKGSNPHNLYLKILCEMGLFGFIPFMMIIVTIFQTIMKVWKIRDDCPSTEQNIQNLMFLVCVSLSVLLVGHLFADFLNHLSSTGNFWILAGMVFALEAQQQFSDS